MPYKRIGKSGVLREIMQLLKGIRRLKDRLTGKSWSRVHRVESELVTVAGLKNPVPSKERMKAKLDAKAKKAKAKKVRAKKGS